MSSKTQQCVLAALVALTLRQGADAYRSETSYGGYREELEGLHLLSLEYQLKAVHNSVLASGDASAMGTQVAAVMAAADHFMAHSDMAQERAQALALPTAQEYHRLGFSLEQRFRRFVLGQILRQQVSDQESFLQRTPSEATSQSSTNSTVEVQQHSPPGTNSTVEADSSAPRQELEAARAAIARLKEEERAEIAKELEEARAQPKDELVREKKATSPSSTNSTAEAQQHSQSSTNSTVEEGAMIRKTKSIPKPTRNEKTSMRRKLVKQVLKWKGITENTAKCDKETLENMMDEMDFAWKPGSFDRMKALAPLRNYCLLSGEVKKLKHEKDKVAGLDTLHALDLELAGRANLQRARVAKRSDDKRQWYRLRAARKVDWLRIFIADVRKKATVANTTAEIQQLFLQITILNMEFKGILRAAAQANEVPWMTVTKDTHLQRFHRFTKLSLMYPANFIAKLGANTLAFFKGVWNSFRTLLRSAERKCVADTQAMSSKIASQEDLPLTNSDLRDLEADGDEGGVDDPEQTSLKEKRSEEEVGAFAKKLEAMDKAQLDEEAQRVGTALDKLSKKAGKGAVDEGTLKSDMERLAVQSAELEKDATTNTGTWPLMQKMEKLEEDELAVESSICKTRSASIADNFRSALQQAMKSMKATLSTPMPILGISGIGGTLGPLASGLEEVIDFRNREIAQFTYTSMFSGPSALGAGVGGYAGLGWKGYKENWTLEEACQTGLWSTKTLSGSVFGLPLGVGVTVVTDADNSGRGPWIPEPNGINEVAFGWGASASTGFNLLSHDWGATKSSFINSECFETAADLVKYVWLPSCKKCEKGAEHFMVSALRSTIILGNMLSPLPQLAYSILIYSYDRIRESPSEYTPECSASSVSTREQPGNLAKQAAKLLFETASLESEVETQVDLLETNLRIAQTFNGENLHESAELRLVQKQLTAAADTCRRVPPDVAAVHEEELSLEQQPFGKLSQMCREFQLHPACEHTRKRYKKFVRIQLFLSLQDGQLTAGELHTLHYHAPKPAKARLHEKMMACSRHNVDDDSDISCMTGLEAARLLSSTLKPKDMYRLCKALDVNCHQWKSSFALSTCKLMMGKDCARWDIEMMSFLIVKDVGGGRVDLASATHPFGACHDDTECPAPNTECAKQPGIRFYAKEDIKRCSCKKNFCHGVDHVGVDGEAVDTCMQDDGGWKDLITDVRIFHMSKRVALGKMIGRLSYLTDNKGAP